VWATTAQLYPGRDKFEFDQGHVTKNAMHKPHPVICAEFTFLADFHLLFLQLFFLCRLFYELLKNKECYLATDIQTKTEKLAAISYFSFCYY